MIRHKLFGLFITFILPISVLGQMQVHNKYDIAASTNHVHIDSTDFLILNGLSTNALTINPINTQQFSTVYPPITRDFRKLGVNTTVYLYAGAVTFGLLWASPESISNWDKEEIKETGLSWKWAQNVKTGPVMDEDDFVLNYVSHPYVGAIYYTTARSCGFKWYESFGYSFLMSTIFWEYGIEAFAEVPSTQDLILTPAVGSVIGEAFFMAKKNILKNKRRVLKSRFLGITSLFLMDPVNTIVDGLGYRRKVTTTLTFTPVSNYYNSKPGLGLCLTAKF